MAEIKINELDALASISAGDYFVVDEDIGGGTYVTKKHDASGIADAVTKKHTQNTDTGTTSTTFQIDSGNSGPKLKQDSGAVYARNAADDADAAVKAASYKTGDYTLTVDEDASLSDKADKDTDAVVGNLYKVATGGDLVDSGIPANGQTITASTASTTIDLSAGYNIELTLEADTSISFSNIPANQRGALMVRQDSTGGWEITNLNTIGYIPSADLLESVTTVAGAVDIFGWWSDSSNNLHLVKVGEDLVSVDTESTTAGTLHIATKDGEAMFFHDTLDFSPWAGTDAGSTPYLFEFVDSSGNKATAYGGAVGGGEVLGSELVVNGDFSAWTGDDPDGWVVSSEDVNNYITEDAGKCRLVSDGSFLYIAQNIGTKNTIEKISLNIVTITSGSLKVKVEAAGTATYRQINGTGITDLYMSLNNDPDLLITRDSGATDVVFDDVSVKKLTDIPATGLHLMSTKNGTTRNMASVDAGFNPNRITTVNIWRA